MAVTRRRGSADGAAATPTRPTTRAEEAQLSASQWARQPFLSRTRFITTRVDLLRGYASSLDLTMWSVRAAWSIVVTSSMYSALHDSQYMR